MKISQLTKEAYWFFFFFFDRSAEWEYFFFLTFVLNKIPARDNTWDCESIGTLSKVIWLGICWSSLSNHGDSLLSFLSTALYFWPRFFPFHSFLLLLLVGLRIYFRVDEFAVFFTFHQLSDYFKIPFTNIFLLPCLPFMFEMDKAEVLFFMPTFSVTICTILVFSLSHSVRFFAEMKYMINKWEGPYSWLITTFRNTVICNSLNALFAIYIYWKLILYVLVLSQWQITGKCIIKRELNSNLSSFLLEIILQLSYGLSSPFQCITLCLFSPLFSFIFEFLS